MVICMKADECPGGDMIMALRAQVAELKAALEPFKVAYDNMFGPSGVRDTMKLERFTTGLTVGDLRAARRALGS